MSVLRRVRQMRLLGLHLEGSHYERSV
jgi:hypothetical protein